MVATSLYLTFQHNSSVGRNGLYCQRHHMVRELTTVIEHKRRSIYFKSQGL
jgi:DUF1680 family protein